MNLELALNLVWLLVVGGMFAVFVAWAADQPNEPRARRGQCRIALTLACIAAVLFPVISMSDDLATAPAAVEAWNAMRRAALIAFVAFDTLPPVLPTLLAARAAHIGHSVHLACAGLIFVSVLSILSPSTATVWSFRAPPFAHL